MIGRDERRGSSRLFDGGLTRLDAGHVDGVVFEVEVAGDLDLFACVVLYLLRVVEEVPHGLALWSVAHDERVVPIFEGHDGAFEAVGHWLGVRDVLLLLRLCVERGRTQAQGYGESEGCEPREESFFLERQNIFPFPFFFCMRLGRNSLPCIGQRVGEVTGVEVCERA